MGPIDTRFGSHVREWGEDVETKMVHYRTYMHCDVIGVFILFHVFLLTLFILSPVVTKMDVLC